MNLKLSFYVTKLQDTEGLGEEGVTSNRNPSISCVRKPREKEEEEERGAGERAAIPTGGRGEVLFCSLRERHPMETVAMECDRHRRARPSIKAHALSNWKEKLRRNCLERAIEDRAHLIWKIRSSAQNLNQQILNSAFRRIISDELMKIERSTPSGKKEFSESDMDDLIWEYDGLQVNPYPGEYVHEELLIEMERLLYEDLRKELIRRELDAYEEEEEYLSRAVFEQMNFDDDQVQKIRREEAEKGQGWTELILTGFCSWWSVMLVLQTTASIANDNRMWCPICKQGELKEDLQLIYCNNCDLHLNLESDKLNLDVLRRRLREAYEEHLDRGCHATPRFCMEARFKITALYIQCPICQTFEIVV